VTLQEVIDGLVVVFRDPMIRVVVSIIGLSLIAEKCL
jgi:hypothetical protein